MDRDDVKYAVVIGVLAAALYIGAHLTLSGCRMEQAAPPKQMEAAAEANHPEIPEGSAAKVAAVMADNGITLPQVAAYLYNLGYTVHPNQLPKWHWSAPTSGSPVAYYTFELVGAVGDTTLTHYLPQAVGTYRLRVRGVDAEQRVGPWSIIGWSDERGPDGALPGVAP